MTVLIPSTSGSFIFVVISIVEENETKGLTSFNAENARRKGKML